MKRRQFLFGSAVASASLLGKRSAAATPPNILFITVDEMRFPMVFPSGIDNADQFLAKFMPNTHKLWQRGVKFTNHQSTAAACSPSRGAFTTGLYSQQHWVTQTIQSLPGVLVPAQPQLDSRFPTYGSLLRQTGYQTPYFGKWHISIPKAVGLLTEYSFDYRTPPDPVGVNLQGTLGYEPEFHSDKYIADQAARWLSVHAGESPWCLTVGFVNPHDRGYFWAGTEYKTYASLFPNGKGKLPPNVDWANLDVASDVAWGQNPLRDPPFFGYPAVPPNWESADQIAANKPSTQTYWRLFNQLDWGGISDDPTQKKFTTAPYPQVPGGNFNVAFAPYSYWQRGLDLYTQVMSYVDVHIGTVLDALPSSVADNTIIVFTSDHGDYAGAHGFTSDKMGSCYREAVNVPLIVVDPTGNFAGDIHTVRNQLTSSVDLVPMLVSLGHNGSRGWITGDLVALYGQRHDMLPLLSSAQAPGRDYVLFTSDELVPLYNFNNSPAHILGLITQDKKLGVYANWVSRATTIDQSSIELEFYDYQTPGGLAETENTPNDPRAQQMLNQLLTDIIPNELQAPLPGIYGQAQADARFKYLLYEGIANHLGILETGVGL